MSRQVLDKIDKLLETREIVSRHSLFQLKHFIIGKERSIQAKMRKCLDELAMRRDALKNIKLSIDEAKDDIALKEIEKSSIQSVSEPTELNKTRYEIQIRKIDRKIEHLRNEVGKMQKTLRETEEEAQFLLESYLTFEQIEPLKPFDDYETNARLWDDKYSQELKLRLLLGRPLDLEFIRCVLALGKNSPIREEVARLLEQIQKQAIAAQEKKKCQIESQV